LTGMELLARLKPAVHKHWLLGLAGLLWGGVGLMLCQLAYGWLAAVQWEWALGLGLLGVALAVAANRFGFSRIAKKNVERICRAPERVCVFYFQAWTGYLIIAFMMTLGIAMRNSPFPKEYLAVVYTTIGGALLLASFHYFARFWRVMVRHEAC